MKVLVAGLPKTGTKTMTAALTVLGYEVYDWMENFYYLGDDWQKQFREGFRLEDMRRMYENVDAVTDCPCDAHWEDFFDAFPDVKVILTTRDEGRWVASLKHQMEQFNRDYSYRLARTITPLGIQIQTFYSYTGKHVAKVNTWPYTSVYALPDETVIRCKRRHERNVKTIVPKEQLLVYEVKEGWEPLCEFLGLPVPDVPFPHKNKDGSLSDEWRKENAIMQRVMRDFKVTLACLFALFAFAIYMIVYCC